MDSCIPTEPAGYRILADHRAPGGGTYMAGDLTPATLTDGYAVAVGGVELADAPDLDPEAVAAILLDLGQQYHTGHVGTWLDGDIVYLDAVSWFRPERREETGQWHRNGCWSSVVVRPAAPWPMTCRCADSRSC